MCLTAPVVQAQQHSFFTHYSTEDGLSQNTVMSMLQDHKDNLWFATWDGINRFDGYNFKTYKARHYYLDSSYRSGHARSDGTVYLPAF